MDEKAQKKILIIDDDEDVNNLIADTLKPKGFDVFGIVNPEDCVDSINEIEPDLIFISLLLPESNGLKLSKLIHSYEKFAKVPIVMIISYHGELDPKYTATIGVVNVLVKPLDPREIVEVALSALGKKPSPMVIEPTSVKAAMDEAPESLSLENEWFAVMDEEVPEKPEPPGVKGPAGPAKGPHDMFDFGHEAEEKKPQPPADKASEILDYDIDEQIVLKETEPAPVKQPAQAKKAKEFVFDDDLLEKGGDLIGKPEQKTITGKTNISAKKILIIAASVVIVAGLSFGAFMMKDTILSHKDTVFSLIGLGKKKTPPTVVAAVPVKKETAPVAAPQQPGQPEGKPVPQGTPLPAVPPVPKEAPATKDIAAAKGPTVVPQPAGKPASQEPPAPVKPAEQKEKAVPREAAKDTKPAAVKAAYAFSTQAGAFGNEKNASSFAEALKKKGFDAFIEKDEKKKVYRVLVGKFDTNNKASDQVRLLKKEGIKAIVYHP